MDPSDESEQAGPARRARRQPSAGLAAAAAVVVIAIAATIAIAGSSSSKPKLPGNAASAVSGTFDGSELTPVKAAPPIDLRDSLGHRVQLAGDRGKVVFVTFLYTHCPDVCPLIATNLRAAQQRLGLRASDVRFIAVSVDPHGDNARNVGTFLRQHDLTGRMEYLLGSASTLGRTWAAWNVGSQQDAASPEFVAHSGLVYGIDTSGKLRTIYAANFKPSDIVHDVPLLER